MSAVLQNVSTPGTSPAVTDLDITLMEAGMVSPPDMSTVFSSVPKLMVRRYRGFPFLALERPNTVSLVTNVEFLSSIPKRIASWCLSLLAKVGKSLSRDILPSICAVTASQSMLSRPGSSPAKDKEVPGSSILNLVKESTSLGSDWVELREKLGRHSLEDPGYKCQQIPSMTVK